MNKYKILILLFLLVSNGVEAIEGSAAYRFGDGTVPLPRVESQELTEAEQTQLNVSLLEALRNKDIIKRVKQFVDQGADVHATDSWGNTVLMLILKRMVPGSWELLMEIPEFVNVPIEKGADINAQNIEGNTVLMLINSMGDYSSVPSNEFLELVNFLIGKGANVHIKDEEGRTALWWATYYVNLEVWKSLIENGADVKARDNEGRTLLMIASSPFKRWVPAGYDIYLYEKKEQLEIMNILIEKGVDVKAKDKKDWTALHWAAYEGDLNTVDFLLANGADINAQNNKGETALMLAIRSEEIVNFLIEKGADVRIKNNKGQTALQQVPVWAFNTKTALRKAQIKSFFSSCRQVFKFKQ